MNIIDFIKLFPWLSPVLKDWLGEGGVPVESSKAERRSLACVHGATKGAACPMNIEPNWWERIKNKFALAIKDQLEVKHRLGLFVAREAELHMCKACGCCLRLKVWTPIGYVQEHITEDQLKQLPDFCWMRDELESLADLPPYEP